MYAFNDNLWKYEIDINYSDQIWDDSPVVSRGIVADEYLLKHWLDRKSAKLFWGLFLFR